MDNEKMLEELDLNEARAMVHRTVVYMESMIQGEWHCDEKEETIKEDEILITLQVKVHDTVVPERMARLRFRYETDQYKVVDCIGHGMLIDSYVKEGEEKKDAKLVAFGDLLDYLIAHLCPAMAIPRAMYYTLCCMKMHVKPELVDEQMQMLENAEKGTFALINTAHDTMCVFCLRVSKDKREPMLYYYRDAENPTYKKLLPKVDSMAELGHKLPPHIDYIQHAYGRGEEMEYIQHPAVVKSLRMLMQHAGLADMDEEMRKKAEEILAAQQKKKKQLPSVDLMGG